MSSEQSRGESSRSRDALESPKPNLKKMKYSTSFNDTWLHDSEFSDWIVKLDEFTAKCKYCNSNISVKYEGKRALTSHLNNKKHKAYINSKVTSHAISSFFQQKGSREEDIVTAIEITSVYHGVKHHHSYVSQDCLQKLYPVLFKDSNCAKKIACARTKSTSICENVLRPAAQQILIKELNEAKYFSIGTDSSNKGNLKMFPVVVQYFSSREGVKQGLLDFYQDPKETSAAIKDQLIRVLNDNNLNLQCVSSLSADNASVNFGVNNSVYQKLVAENNRILKANCKCHVLHNCTKFALKGLRFDVESLVLKIYSEFSAYAKRTEKLKTFFHFVDIEYRQILKHVPTRWLSLLPAIERMLSSWPALREYFLEEGESECSELIWKAFKEEDSFGFCCANFLFNVMQIFEEGVKVLETNYVTCTELHTVMENIRKKIVNRKKDKFFGKITSSILKNLKDNEEQYFIKDADTFLERCLIYLNKWYDFNNSEFKQMSILSMDKEITWDSIKELSSFLKLMEINEDKLYEDFCILREVREVIAAKTSRVDLRWSSFFCDLKEGTGNELKKIVSFVLSIPVSNAAYERIFSVIGEIWTNNRNRLTDNHVKSEIQVCTNFKYSCKEFYDFIFSKPEIIKAAQRNEKYAFKLNK